MFKINNNTINKSKRKVFRKFFISYLLIGAVPLFVLGALFYYYNVINYEKNVKDSNLAKLVQVKNQVDIDLKVLKDVTYHMSNNPQILNSNYNIEEFKKMDIVSQLEAYKENSAFLEDILLYFRGDKYAYLTQGYYNYFDFENSVKKDLNWSEGTFFTKLNTVVSPRIDRINSSEANLDKRNNIIALMYPVPYLSKQPVATVVYTIKEKDILSKFETFIGDFKGHIFIYDNQNNLLVFKSNGYTAEERSTLQKQMMQFKGTGIFDVHDKKNSYVLMRTVSEETGWSYVAAMPPTYFYKSVNIMRSIVIAIMSILILTGLVLAYVMSKKNYGPINTLISYINNQEPQPDTYEGINELEMIRRSVESNYERNRELVVQVDAQRQFVREQCLGRLLRGKVKDIQELDYLLKCSNIQLDGAGFFTLVISTVNDTNHIYDMGKLRNLINEIHFAAGRGYGVELVQEKAIVIIVSIDKNPNDLRESQRAIVNDVSSILEKEVGLIPFIGIGNVYEDVLQLNTSFLEASSVVNDNRTHTGSSNIFYSDLKKLQQQVYWYAVTEQALFIQSLKQGDKAVAAEALNSISSAIKEKNPNYDMLRCICFDILNCVIKSVYSMNVTGANWNIQKLAKFESLEEFLEGMQKFSSEFCDYIDEIKENRNSQMKNNIINYVNNNFTSDTISLDDIAEKFELTPAYVSGFFKNETGVNFIEYISNLRMDFIKKQLLNSEKPIKDIISEAGYIDAASFTRKFRILEGITPGQYRKMANEH